MTNLLFDLFLTACGAFAFHREVSSGGCAHLFGHSTASNSRTASADSVASPHLCGDSFSTLLQAEIDGEKQARDLSVAFRDVQERFLPPDLVRKVEDFGFFS